MTIRLIDRKVRVFAGNFRSVDYTYNYRSPSLALTEPAERMVLESSDTAAVVLHLLPQAGVAGGHRLVFTRRFRMPSFDFNGLDDARNGYITELIGGRLRARERPYEAARRKLDQRAGGPAGRAAGLERLRISQATHIVSAFVSPRQSTEQAHIFYFQGMLDGPVLPMPAGDLIRGDAEEAIRMEMYSPNEFFDEVEFGRFADVKALLAVDWLRRHAVELFDEQAPDGVGGRDE